MGVEIVVGEEAGIFEVEEAADGGVDVVVAFGEDFGDGGAVAEVGEGVDD